MKFGKSANEEGLEAAINAVLASMQACPDKHSADYNKLVENLEKLYELKGKEYSPRERVSINTVLSVAGSLAGIIVIVGYERAHVMTSKALQMLVKTPLNR